ncbi:hypothetical protein BGZ54_002319 [Gamsiella multidivaricata]|nr:hypothetical protein BGZ54_002319 [Gamsiella multidivaricata]
MVLCAILNLKPFIAMPSISGQVVSSSRQAAGLPVPIEIGPNSRLIIQLLDVSLMDAPSVTLSEETISTGPSGHLRFPIPYSLSYDPSQIQPYQSISISASVVDTSVDDETLTWISTIRHSVLTQNNPSNNIDIEIEFIADRAPAPWSTLSGTIVASEKAEALGSDGIGIGPNSKILVQLRDVSLMDAPSVLISEQVITTEREETKAFPIKFSLQFDSKAINERNMYFVSVRIQDLQSDDLKWISMSSHAVLTGGEPSDDVVVDLDLIRS